LLQDGVLNEYRFLDQTQTIPLNVPIASGQTFVVSLEFLNTNSGQTFLPSVVYDTDGCQASKNTAFVIPGGWFDACLLGVSGDWMIRAVVDCCPSCPGDLDDDGVRDLTDFTLFAATYGSVIGDANYSPCADLDSDGVVDLTDFGLFAAGYGVSCL
jgi:hypothetical protein